MGMALGGVVLCVASATAVALLGIRVSRTDDPHFAFLAWNLGLAWIPLALSLALLAAHRLRFPAWTLAGGIAVWLLFLPNAPYILTDYIHLAPDSRVPLWFDFVLIGAFATAGLLLGFASVFLVQVIVSERLGSLAGWSLSMAVFVFSAVGIYVGRVLRFNSWDALQEPGALASLALARLEDPLGNSLLVATVLLFTSFLVVAYLALCLTGMVMLRGLRLALPNGDPHKSAKFRRVT